jgi:glycosyltransferase involved in cell wall biosynthesis
MTDRIRVLHLRSSNFVGGPERQLLRYGEYEREGPLELIFGTLVGETEGHDFARAVKERGLQVLTLPAGTMGDASALRGLVRYLRQQSITLICTHGYQADILGTLAGRLTGVPVAWFLRGWTGENWRVRVYERLDRTLLPLATRVVCLSQGQASQLARRRSLASNIRVVPNAVEVRSISAQERLEARWKLGKRLGLSNESPLVATAGRLSPEKGTAYFLQAMPRVLKSFPAAHFVVFGGGPLKARLEETAQRLGLGTLVRYAGFVPNLPELLPGVDIMVNPALSEVMPNAVLESMAAGVPVVATNVGGVAEIAGPDGAIALVPPADSTAIADAVSGLLHDLSRAAELGRAGQKRVQEAYSPVGQKALLRALYQEMVAGLAGMGTNLQLTQISQNRNQFRVPNFEFRTRNVGLTMNPQITLIPQNDSVSHRGTERRSPLVEVPFITVVIPVRNEEADLEAVLDDLTSQDYPHNRFEILVVDGQSTDGTGEVVRSYARRKTEILRYATSKVAPPSHSEERRDEESGFEGEEKQIPVATATARKERRGDSHPYPNSESRIPNPEPRVLLLSNPGRLSSAGRNIGVQHSRGEVIVFVDGHCRISSRSLLSDAARVMRETGAECLCRPQPLTAPGNSWFQDVVAHARASVIGHGRESTIYAIQDEGFSDPTTSGAIYRRSVFDRVGGYDERFDACEDLEFNYRVFRAGIPAYLSPRLAVAYQPRSSLSGLFRQAVRYGRGRFRFMSKHRAGATMAQLVPAAFVAGLALGAVGSLVSTLVRESLLVALAAYVILLLGFSAKLGLRYGWRHFVASPMVYMAIHFGFGVGYWVEAWPLNHHRDTEKQISHKQTADG